MAITNDVETNMVYLKNSLGYLKFRHLECPMSIREMAVHFYFDKVREINARYITSLNSQASLDLTRRIIVLHLRLSLSPTEDFSMLECCCIYYQLT